MFGRHFVGKWFILPILIVLLSTTSLHAFESWLTVVNDSAVNVEYTIFYDNIKKTQSLAPCESMKYVVVLQGKNPPLPTATIVVKDSLINQEVKFNWRAEKGSLATITSTKADADGKRLLRMAVTNEPKPK